MAIRVAVTLWEHPLRVGLVDDAVGRAAADLFLDVVVQRVDRLAAVDAASVVPIQAVVAGRGADAGANRIIATTEQRDFFIERTRDLAFEGKTAGVHGGAVAFIIDGNGRVRRIRVGLVADEGVEVVEITGC